MGLHNYLFIVIFPKCTFLYAGLVSGVKIVKRPMFQRLLSVPVETQSKAEIHRSFSHPGALRNLKLDKPKEESNFKSDIKRPGTKKRTKKGYSKFWFQGLIYQRCLPL